MTRDGAGTAVPWAFFLVVLALSAPLWVLGGFTSAEIMPGLPLSALMFLCAAVTACLFAWRAEGPSGVPGLLLRTFDLRRIPSPGWYAPSLLLMPGVLVVTYAVMRVVGMPLPDPEIPWRDAPVLFAMFFFAAAGEEIAWSATTLEPLQARMGLLRAGLVIGVVTAAWHAIPFAQAHPSAAWIVGQCAFTVAFRVVAVWLYDRTGRSVFAVVLYHASYNLAWQLFPNRGSGYDPWITAVVMTLVAAGLFFLDRKRPEARAHKTAS